MRSVCFFMVYHRRPSLTKMSIDDMCVAMQTLANRGMEVTGIVIGDSYNIAAFCASRNVRHEMFENRPLSDKFTYAWLRAIQQRKDYICWYGSNNVHGAGYWEVAMNRLEGNKAATFGTRNCVIMSASEGEPQTCLFHPSEGYLISSGQFFLTSTLMTTINLLTLYSEFQKFNFDGVLLDKLTERWGQEIVEVVEYDEEDCIDVKDETNIHSYKSYIDTKAYRRLEDRVEIMYRHPCLANFFHNVYD